MNDLIWLNLVNLNVRAGLQACSILMKTNIFDLLRKSIKKIERKKLIPESKNVLRITPTLYVL